MKATFYIISNFVGRRGFLTKDQIAEMLSSGLVEVGAHSLNHPDLKHIPEERMKKEVTESKKALEDMLGIQVKTFAYPGGSYNDAVVEAVKEASYEAAVTTKPGIEIAGDSLFTMPRIRPGFLTANFIITFFDRLHL